MNRSGYYKWKSRKGTQNRYEKDRDLLTSLLYEAHIKHKSYGYHKLAKIVRDETGWMFSDNLAHKCCKYAGIKAKIRHYNWKGKKYGDENKQFPNVVNGKWNAETPLQLIASDMTVIRHKGKSYELKDSIYDTKLELYKKGKLVRTVDYNDIIEITNIKTWQNNVFINCKPIGINIYKVSDEIFNKIKEITNK